MYAKYKFAAMSDGTPKFFVSLVYFTVSGLYGFSFSSVAAIKELPMMCNFNIYLLFWIESS